MAELQRLPVGYLDDVMLFHNFAQAWERFTNAESSDQEKMADEHALYGVCREIYYEQQGDRLKARRKQRGHSFSIDTRNGD